MGIISSFQTRNVKLKVVGTHTCSPQAQLSSSSKKLLTAEGDGYEERQRNAESTTMAARLNLTHQTRLPRQKTEGARRKGPGHLLQASFFQTGQKCG